MASIKESKVEVRLRQLSSPSKAVAIASQPLSRPSMLTGPLFLPVNDPAPVPEPNAAHGSYHWTFERLLAAGLVPLTIAPFASGSLNPAMDAVLCSAVLLHSHMGFQQCIVDYVPKKKYPGLRKTTWWMLNAATVLVGVGLYEFETNDVGVTEAIKRVWKA
ncbi:succinate dehydrogenase cytochrome b small subunit [Drechmeria coniospora]|uniref:Succinate dehydrogenase [ubiquinone] cytochrome b small subunit n=1 Tax=Drechmeria coniospora TaxID=98403 RepID=A0A151GI27_DRECN|nr:succinate dehydrogenase cytochrome b small subunit [Drechmeria coniospora]KYK56750.1 succinate dehydrogenase cytochrome b small subunit [Drechmeria coniospora]